MRQNGRFYIVSLCGFYPNRRQLRDTQKGAKGAEMAYPVRIGTKPADYVNEMRAAFDHGLYRAALMLAVAIPDICAALESESSRTNGERYKKQPTVSAASKGTGTAARQTDVLSERSGCRICESGRDTGTQDGS